MALTEATKYRRKMGELADAHCLANDSGEHVRAAELVDEMCRLVPPLYGAAEVSDKLGVLTSNLAPSGRRGLTDLPRPVVRLRSTRLWLAGEIDDFAKAFKKRRQGSMEERKVLAKERRAKEGGTV